MAFFDEQFGGEQVFPTDEQSQSLSQILGDASLSIIQYPNEQNMSGLNYFQNKDPQCDLALNIMVKREDDQHNNDNCSSDSSNRPAQVSSQISKFQNYFIDSKNNDAVRWPSRQDQQQNQICNQQQHPHHIGRPLSETKAIFHTIEGKLFMSVDYILEHPQNAVQMAEQQKKRAVTRQHTSKHKVEHGQEFHWSKEYCTKFAVACMAIGIQNVTPKQLQGVLPFEISRESVGSHLQKYRLKLQKQYHLIATSEIRNYHYPKDIEDERLIQFKEMWEKGFTGFSLDEVKQMLLHGD